jgi:hypothetical protein
MCPQFTVLLARTLPEWYGEHSLNRFSVPMLPNTPLRDEIELAEEFEAWDRASDEALVHMERELTNGA